MIIPTKYNVGDTFWVPRSIDHYETEELCYEGEVWNRKIKVIRPSVKQKIIVKIEVSVNKNNKVLIQYYCINCKDIGIPTMSQVYAQDEIHDYTEEEALAVAKDYANRNETYYGT